MFKSPTLVVLFVVCASAQGEPVEYKRTQAEFTVKIVFGTQDKIRDKCARLGAWGGEPPRGPGIFGCNVYDKDTNTTIIYTTKPMEVDDEATTTLGHELLHTYAGKYHN